MSERRHIDTHQPVGVQDAASWRAAKGPHCVMRFPSHGVRPMRPVARVGAGRLSCAALAGEAG